MKFTWSSGQKPLDGFTVKRGIGAGGFGEVYYALSDGGKEVALKLVRGNHEVELRGIAQCMNLKHPHLVGLYDLKTDSSGDHWVVMEYVSGDPLSGVLNKHPAGLPQELAREWFLMLAKAVGYLHDHGIVHRDLKPANIFVENGILKLGDYGLAKFISSSQRNAQTQSVGTVYYMAPEISTGNYSKQIDVYAAGIILYEMLTGQVPFEGESAGEILIKHLTTPPDLSKLPAEYVPIVSKALAKNPAQRYATITEMAREVEAFGGRRPAPILNGHGHPVEPYRPRPMGLAEELPTVVPVSLRIQAAELAGSLALAAVLAGLMAMLYAALVRVPNWPEIGSVYFLTVAVSWAVLVPAKFWDGSPGHSLQRRIVMLVFGIAVGLATLWLHGWVPPARTGSLDHFVSDGWYAAGGRNFPARDLNPFSVAAGFLSYFGLGLAAIRWWKMCDRGRSQRFSTFPVLAAGFWALVLLLLWPEEPAHGAIALVTAAVIVQWVSPWQPPPARQSRRLRVRYA